MPLTGSDTLYARQNLLATDDVELVVGQILPDIIGALDFPRQLLQFRRQRIVFVVLGCSCRLISLFKLIEVNEIFESQVIKVLNGFVEGRPLFRKSST